MSDIAKEKGDEYYETISVQTDRSGVHNKPNIKSSDYITRIFACATMWHETKDEMMEFLKSIVRMDEDQCARRVAQKYLRIVDPDYYEFESKCFLNIVYKLNFFISYIYKFVNNFLYLTYCKTNRLDIVFSKNGTMQKHTISFKLFLSRNLK